MDLPRATLKPLNPQTLLAQVGPGRVRPWSAHFQLASPKARLPLPWKGESAKKPNSSLEQTLKPLAPEFLASRPARSDSGDAAPNAQETVSRFLHEPCRQTALGLEVSTNPVGTDLAQHANLGGVPPSLTDFPTLAGRSFCHLAFIFILQQVLRVRSAMSERSTSQCLAGSANAISAHLFSLRKPRGPTDLAARQRTESAVSCWPAFETAYA